MKKIVIKSASDVIYHFEKICRLADKKNSEARFKRFITFKQATNRNEATTIGIYDYKTKAHEVFEVHHFDAVANLQYMYEMLEAR